MTHTTAPLAPNHHADHGGFAGPSGFLLGLVMAVGRGSDARLAARLADVRASDRVVDIGCGPGTAVRLAARTAAQATGVDPAPVMRRLARRFTRSSDRVRYLEGTAEALPLDDGSASVAWSLATVHHWSDIEAGLREVRRVLQPGGRFLAIERRSAPGATGLGSHGWTDEQAEAFADACRSHGFEAVQVEHPTTRRRRRVVAVTCRKP